MKNRMKPLAIILMSTFSLLASTSIKAAESTNASGINPVVAAIALSTVNILGNYDTMMQAIGVPFIAQQLLFFPAAAGQANLSASHLVELQSSQNTINFIFGSITPPANANATPVPGLPITYTPGVYAAMVPTDRTALALAQIRYLTVGSLTATTKFQSFRQQLEASTFIQYLGDAGNRVTPVTADILNNANVGLKNNYLNLLANYNAAQSVSLNTLYKAYNKRIPLPQLKGESALSADETLALQGMQPEWLTQVAKMSAADLQRMGVYQQAYTNYQIFQLRMAMEDLNTNMAVMNLSQQQGVEKTQLLAAAQAVISSATRAETTTTTTKQ